MPASGQLTNDGEGVPPASVPAEAPGEARRRGCRGRARGPPRPAACGVGRRRRPTVAAATGGPAGPATSGRTHDFNPSRPIRTGALLAMTDRPFWPRRTRIERGQALDGDGARRTLAAAAEAMRHEDPWLPFRVRTVTPTVRIRMVAMESEAVGLRVRQPSSDAADEHLRARVALRRADFVQPDIKLSRNSGVDTHRSSPAAYHPGICHRTSECSMAREADSKSPRSALGGGNGSTPTSVIPGCGGLLQFSSPAGRMPVRDRGHFTRASRRRRRPSPRRPRHAAGGHREAHGRVADDPVQLHGHAWPRACAVGQGHAPARCRGV